MTLLNQSAGKLLVVHVDGSSGLGAGVYSTRFQPLGPLDQQSQEDQKYHLECRSEQAKNRQRQGRYFGSLLVVRMLAGSHIAASPFDDQTASQGCFPVHSPHDGIGGKASILVFEIVHELIKRGDFQHVQLIICAYRGAASVMGEKPVRRRTIVKV